MAFGIDDALAVARSGVTLGDTIVEIVKRHRKKKDDYDVEMLIEEVRIDALRKIDQADFALTQLERLLLEKKVNIDRSVLDVIAETPFWQPFEQHRLAKIRDQLNALGDGLYKAGDDIAAILRCRDRTGEMGRAIVESSKSKYVFNQELLKAPTIRKAIALLRDKLAEHKAVLS